MGDITCVAGVENNALNVIEEMLFNVEEEVMFKLLELRKSKTLCDVNIVKSDSVIHAHSSILAAKCSFFLDFMLNFSAYEWSVKRPLKIDISSLSNCENDELNCMRCASQIIDFLYSGKIIIDSIHVCHLNNLSRNLKLKELTDMCQQFLLSRKVKQESDKKKSSFTSDPFVCCLPQEKAFQKSTLPNTTNTFVENSLSENCNIQQLETFDPIEKESDEYCCIQCCVPFKSYKMLEAHQKVFHEKQFTCLSCDFKCIKLSYILFHLFNMPHDENCCSVCLFEASDRLHLREHFKDHMGELPYKCYECGSMFKIRKDWLQHALNNHKGSYLCKSCGISFFSKASLNKHNLLHSDTDSNFICEFCGFGALYKSVFQRHLLKHTGKERQKFTCSVVPCSFKSHSKYNLKVHMLSHDTKQQQLFPCDLCALKFTKEGNLKRHIQTVHNQGNNFYSCSRCDYKNARFDKAKAHCETIHSQDAEALRFITDQHHRKKKEDLKVSKKKTKKDKSKLDSGFNSDENQKDLNMALPQDKKEKIESCNDLVPKNVKKSYILSETTGEFHIISENEGGQIPVARVTSTNVLTIGNFRKGTGSVTLNETTGVLTFNNINSESTGAVFLNESTGELSYINLGNESVIMDTDSEKNKEFLSHINEYTGEINNDDFIFDSFEMDIGNEDSCDGFDDLDGLLFDPIDVDNTDHLDLLRPNNDEETSKVIPHLNETTGELSFDYIESQKNSKQVWQSTHKSFTKEVNLEEEHEDSYRVLLNEFTGEFS